MELMSEFLLFFLKLISVLILVGFVFVLIASAAGRAKKMDKETLVVEHLNQKFKETKRHIEHHVLEKKTLKAQAKAEKAKQRVEKKAEKRTEREAKKVGADAQSDTPEDKPRLFVLCFEGDLRASGASVLAREISALLSIARPEQDEVLLTIESPGGVVHGYGYAASQIERLKDKGVRTTVAIDKVAASGGYMMSCVADAIISAPFAVVGSIGVVAQIPNFNRLLKKNDIDIELLTAGEHKRTLTMLGENTEQGRTKFLDDLEQTHALFKSFVADHRPGLDMDKVSTGEHWYGYRAKALGLVDEIKTSDAFIMDAIATKDVYRVYYEVPKSWMEKLTASMGGGVFRLIEQLWAYTNLKS